MTVAVLKGRACTAYAPKHRLQSASSSAKQPLKYFLKQSLKHFLQAQLFYSLIFDRLCYSRLRSLCVVSERQN